jgi:hypothetical protein
MENRRKIWWLFIGIPIIFGSISIIISGFSWIPQFLTGGLALVIVGIVFQGGYDRAFPNTR